jgi:hypothetical protein
VDGGVGVDGHAELVDSDVMVVPAERYEIGRVVVATVLAFVDVVDLEPVSATASLDGTLALVAV